MIKITKGIANSISQGWRELENGTLPSKGNVFPGTLWMPRVTTISQSRMLGPRPDSRKCSNLGPYGSFISLVQPLSQTVNLPPTFWLPPMKPQSPGLCGLQEEGIS